VKAKVYLETSLVSYITSNPSRDIVVASRQQITQVWWETQRARFTLYISPFVIQEASVGDPNAVKKRLSIIKHLPLLEVNEEILTLASSLLKDKAIPEKSTGDALHLAIAAFHRIDYLLTWNYKHLANAEKRGLITRTIQNNGYNSPIICTPEELMGE
jgi:predicted nucleic acid-binding protein